MLALLLLAHSWYPVECCSERDCHPTAAVEKVHGGYRVEGRFVPSALTRPSRDGQYHLCANAHRVICFFVPTVG